MPMPAGYGQQRPKQKTHGRRSTWRLVLVQLVAHRLSGVSLRNIQSSCLMRQGVCTKVRAVKGRCVKQSRCVGEKVQVAPPAVFVHQPVSFLLHSSWPKFKREVCLVVVTLSYQQCTDFFVRRPEGRSQKLHYPYSGCAQTADFTARLPSPVYLQGCVSFPSSAIAKR